MRAIRFQNYGPPSVLALEEVPTPEPGPGEVLVKVSAAGINRADVGAVAGAFKSTTPRVPGRDFAGVIVEGDGVQVLGGAVVPAMQVSVTELVYPLSALAVPLNVAVAPANTLWLGLEIDSSKVGVRIRLNCQMPRP